jgi:hypothetical protein
MICQRLLQSNSSSAIIQKDIIKYNTRSKLTVNAMLMVTMAFSTACISSLSSKMSFCQGVTFQSISYRGNLKLDDDESNIYPPDVLGPFSAWSI